MPPPKVPHVSDELARSAREHFQHRYREPLTDHDGREIATNLLGVFALLKEWRDKRDAAVGIAPVPPPPEPAGKAERRRKK